MPSKPPAMLWGLSEASSASHTSAHLNTDPMATVTHRASSIPEHVRRPHQTVCLPVSSSSSSLSSLSSLHCSMAAGKSAKRQAAEALLASRYGSSGASQLRALDAHEGSACKRAMHAKAGASSSSPTSPTSSNSSNSELEGGAPAAKQIVVPGCPPSCSFTPSTGVAWCQFEVQLPHVQWAKVFADNPASVPVYRIAEGYQKWYFSEGVEVLVVEDAKHLPDALAKLKASMKDQVIAIDLEWRPERAAGRFSPVALMQLASSTTCLLIRTCRMHYKLHPALLEFLASPGLQVVGFSWHMSDEAKMVATFQAGHRAFSSFHDLQQVASRMGYPGYGLAKLTHRVLGYQMHKSKKVTMSNWEDRVLSKGQVKYAALDALITGMLYRVLRLWHSSSSPCAVCRQPLGSLLPAAHHLCMVCDDKSFKSFNDLLAHGRQQQHAVSHDLCSGCGRVHRLATPHVPPLTLKGQVALLVQAPTGQGSEGSRGRVPPG